MILSDNINTMQKHSCYHPLQVAVRTLYKTTMTSSLLVYEYIVLGNRGKTRNILVDLPTA